jgi:UV DNA damage endonuclease
MGKANYGYCCINLTLQKDHDIKIGRSMIKRTFTAKGIKYAGELAEANVRDLIEIIKWNHKQGINVYRMSSSMFPWMSEYELTDLPNWQTISNLLKGAGALVQKYNQRVGFHPGQFCVLPSPTPKTVDAAIRELDQSAFILDSMGLPQNHTYSMNIHVGGSYGDKDAAKQRFVDNFKRLSKSAQARLVLENDDKPAQYGVEDLYEIYEKTNIPITFDYHHHRCYEDPMPEKDALELCAKTWPKGIRQLCHYSSSKKIHEDESVILRAHADYIYEKIETYNMDIDIELEVKAKELALIKYRKEYLNDLVLS